MARSRSSQAPAKAPPSTRRRSRAKATATAATALDAGFCELSAIAIDGAGRIFLADDEAHQVRMIDTDNTVSTLAGDGIAAYDGDGGPSTLAHLNTPTSLALDNDGNLLIADSLNHVIRRIDMQTHVISTAVGSHPTDFHGGFGGDGGLCTSAELNEPSGIAVAHDGSLYVSDSYNNRIRRVEPVGDTISTFAGTGVTGLTGDDGVATAAEMKHPQRLSISTTGTEETLYIGDTFNSVARSIRLE